MKRKWSIKRERLSNGDLLSGWWVKYPHGASGTFSSWQKAYDWAYNAYLVIYVPREEQDV